MKNPEMKGQKYIIAVNIKSNRKKPGITQKELAEKPDLSIETIKCVGAGKRTTKPLCFYRQ